jgi:hypothetical protein
MTEQTVAIHIPAPLYQRLERLATLTNHSLEQVVVQTLAAGVPPLPDDVPEAMRASLTALESLDDAALWQVAREMMSPEQQEQFFQLREQQQAGTIPDDGRATLAQLHQDADRLMLRKAYAYVLLKWRGQRLPTLDALEAQE